MKRRVLLSVSVMFLLSMSLKTLFGQDTIIMGSFPSGESFKSMTEDWKIMEQAFKEQFKEFKLNSDSLKHHIEIFKKQMKNMPDQFSMPFEYKYDFKYGYTKNLITKTVDLRGESKTKEIVVNVEKQAPAMFLTVRAGVKSGNINIEIYDPNGKKQGGFSVENNDNPDGEIVNGLLNKTFSAPQLGLWKVKIDSEKAYGNVFITSTQKP